MFLSYKVRLNPNNKQATLLKYRLKKVNALYNGLIKKYLLNDSNESLDKKLRKIPPADKLLSYYLSLREDGYLHEKALLLEKHSRLEYQDLTLLDINSDISNVAINGAIKDFKKLCTSLSLDEKTKIAFKPAERPISMALDNKYLELDESTVQFKDIITEPRLVLSQHDHIKLCQKGRIPPNTFIYAPRLSFDGLYLWLIVSVKLKQFNTLLTPVTEPIGIDVGIKQTTLSNGQVFPSINHTLKIKNLENKISRLTEALNRTEKSSHNHTKIVLLLRRAYRRIYNIRKDYDMKIADYLAKKHPKYIVMEDLSVTDLIDMNEKPMVKSLYKEHFRNLKEHIISCLRKYNIPVLEADRFFPSSKMCSFCHRIKKDLKLSDRTFICPYCHATIDRDLNAAINLRHAFDGKI